MNDKENFMAKSKAEEFTMADIKSCCLKLFTIIYRIISIIIYMEISMSIELVYAEKP
jgi:hypothetical protein